jgi:hypothetical protein
MAAPAHKRARLLRGLHAESWTSRAGLARILRGLADAGQLRRPEELGLAGSASGSRLNKEIGEALLAGGAQRTPYGPLLQSCQLTEGVSIDYLCPQAMARSLRCKMRGPPFTAQTFRMARAR